MLMAGIPREQLFYTSKIPPGSINYKAATECVNESLKKTGLEYIDLYLLHAPYGGKEGRLGAWKALVEAVDAGKVRSIGVSNYGMTDATQFSPCYRLILAVARDTGLPYHRSASSR